MENKTTEQENWNVRLVAMFNRLSPENQHYILSKAEGIREAQGAVTDNAPETCPENDCPPAANSQGILLDAKL